MKEVQLFLREYFHQDLDENKLYEEFSGGQRTLISIALGFLKNPEILLLDEPTNHLDLDAKKILITLINHFPGAVICVSHDVWFLNQITQTLWILEEGGLRFFTGSYEEYRQENLLHEKSRERRLEVINKEERKLKQSQLREQKRAQRSEQKGKAHAVDRSTGRGAQGFFKEKAEQRKAQRKNMLDRKEGLLVQAREQLTPSVKKKVSGSVVTRDTKGGLFHISHATLFIHGQPKVAGITLDMYKGDRVACKGANGSGKSAFVKAILGYDGFSFDEKLYRNPSLRFEYFDQHYGCIDPDKTILENVLNFSGESVERVRQHLSHFLFNDALIVMKKARSLSGGMLARLAFVMLTITPIDLLILDEPTNNLDIETIDAIVEILKEFQGGLLVISHDQHFIDRLAIQRTYEISSEFKQVYDTDGVIG
jgi:ATPase subunit of ABC transporter with duplicated ATPase domains